MLEWPCTIRPISITIKSNFNNSKFKDLILLLKISVVDETILCVDFCNLLSSPPTDAGQI